MVFKFFKKSGVEVIVFVSLSVRLFQRRGSLQDTVNHEIYFNFNEVFFVMPLWVIMM